jgi:hypothetical protein
MKLYDYTWWPRNWTTICYEDVRPERVTKEGTFETCKLTSLGLMIEVGYHGSTVLGRVPRPSVTSPRNLAGLRDFLLQHSGLSLAKIEDLEVTSDQFNTHR